MYSQSRFVIRDTTFLLISLFNTMFGSYKHLINFDIKNCAKSSIKFWNLALLGQVILYDYLTSFNDIAEMKNRFRHRNYSSREEKKFFGIIMWLQTSGCFKGITKYLCYSALSKMIYVGLKITYMGLDFASPSTIEYEPDICQVGLRRTRGQS